MAGSCPALIANFIRVTALRLCLKGNPNLMELLWISYGRSTELRRMFVTSPVLDSIRAMRTSFFTTAMSRSYLGWVTKERRILGGYENVVDPQPATKRASHLVRLLLGLRDAFTTGQLPVFLEGPDRDLVMAFKMGDETLTQALFTVDMLTEQCKTLESKANWPEPDPKPIEDIVIRARMEML